MCAVFLCRWVLVLFRVVVVANVMMTLISDQIAKCCYSILYTNLNGDNAESNSQAPPITIQIGAFNPSGFHSLVVSQVGAIQNNMLDSRANPTNIKEQGKSPRNKKDRPAGRAQARAPV